MGRTTATGDPGYVCVFPRPSRFSCSPSAPSHMQSVLHDAEIPPASAQPASQPAVLSRSTYMPVQSKKELGRGF
jgi:hypothetical protein